MKLKSQKNTSGRRLCLSNRKFVYKELTWEQVFKACKNSAIATAQVLVLVAAAQLMALNLILLIMGMFMEGTGAILILTPLIYPIAINLGIDPIHLGVIMVTNLAMGMYTPPFGINLFVTSSVTGLKMVEILPGIVSFVIANIIAIIIITYFPQISLFLPNLLG